MVAGHDYPVKTPTYRRSLSDSRQALTISRAVLLSQVSQRYVDGFQIIGPFSRQHPADRTPFPPVRCGPCSDSRPRQTGPRRFSIAATGPSRTPAVATAGGISRAIRHAPSPVGTTGQYDKQFLILSNLQCPIVPHEKSNPPARTFDPPHPIPPKAC